MKEGFWIDYLAMVILPGLPALPIEVALRFAEAPSIEEFLERALRARAWYPSGFALKRGSAPMPLDFSLDEALSRVATIGEGHWLKGCFAASRLV